MDRTMRQLRMIPQQFETREDGDARIIEGYFAVFNSVYQIAPGLSESIAPTAFDKTISGDIRALINHDTTLVVGRTAANTLQLRIEARGLWGQIRINPNDQDAMNAWARVQRGDVDGCSMGFEIIREDTEVREDGSIHWTIEELKLYEVSICTFPAYEETNIQARTKEAAEITEKRKQEQLREWKTRMHERLKGGPSNGTENPDAPEEN